MTDEEVPAEFDPDETVVVPTGEGERFHRPGRFVFTAACKTEFSRPVREMPLSEAARVGFTPCENPACFGDLIE